MLGNFTYCNPTKLYFGKTALDGLNDELPKYGKNVLLVYGGGFSLFSIFSGAINNDRLF